MNCTNSELKQILDWGIIDKKTYKAWLTKREALKLKTE